MEEVFVSVKGLEGWYEVSNKGTVRSLDRRVNIHHNSTRLSKGQEISHDVSEDGYHRVQLVRNRKGKKYLVHQLMMEAFEVPNPLNLPCVNHRDENKANNFLFINPDGSVDLEKSNLEWCGYGYNTAYNGGLERRLETRKKRGTAKTDPKKIIGISVKDGSELNYDSISDAKKAGFHNAGLVLRGLRPTCKGYRFIYADERNSVAKTKTVAEGRL